MVALSMLRWSIYLCFRYFFLRFSYSLMQFPPSILKLSTQHPPYFFKLSTQHQAAITRFENRVIPPTQGLQFSYTLIRAFSKISAYTKTVQFYSTENTSMNKFLAQSSSPCLMLGGIPPASLSEGCWCSHGDEARHLENVIGFNYGHLARYVKLWVAHPVGMLGTFSPTLRFSDHDMHHGTCVTHVSWYMPDLLTSGFFWSRWRGQRSRHFRRMHNPQFRYLVKGPWWHHDMENLSTLLALCGGS